MNARMAAELRHTPVCTTAQLFVGQFCEPALDPVQPRAVGRREVHAGVRSTGEPIPDQYRLMSCVPQWSMIEWTSKFLGTATSMASRNCRNSTDRCRRWNSVMRRAVLAFSAATGSSSHAAYSRACAARLGPAAWATAVASGRALTSPWSIASSPMRNGAPGQRPEGERAACPLIHSAHSHRMPPVTFRRTTSPYA